MSFKPLSVDDFNLSGAEKKLLVEGAQKFFPPVDDEGEPLVIDPDEGDLKDYASKR